MIGASSSGVEFIVAIDKAGVRVSASAVTRVGYISCSDAFALSLFVSIFSNVCH